MNEDRKSLGLLAVVPIACCIGLPLIAAAGISVAAAAWVGGITGAALVLVGVVLLAVRARRQRTHGPTTSIPGAHS